jgi:hypothetical protein
VPTDHHAPQWNRIPALSRRADATCGAWAVVASVFDRWPLIALDEDLTKGRGRRSGSRIENEAVRRYRDDALLRRPAPPPRTNGDALTQSSANANPKATGDRKDDLRPPEFVIAGEMRATMGS